MMMVFQAAFLSFPPSRIDSPVNTRLSGVRVSEKEARVKVRAASTEGRLLGLGACEEEGEVPYRPEKEPPNCDMLARGDGGLIGLNEEEDVVGMSTGDLSCSTSNFI